MKDLPPLMLSIIHEEDVFGYEFLNTLGSLPDLSKELDKKCHSLKPDKLSMFPECEKESHEIVTEDHSPIRIRPYRITPEESHHLKAELGKYCRLGTIRPSRSQWASSIILAKKADSSYRLIVNYKKLNLITKKDAYPLPGIVDILNSLGNAIIFSSLDMRKAFFQKPVRDNDVSGASGTSGFEKSCFCTKFASFEMLRMGQELALHQHQIDSQDIARLPMKLIDTQLTETSRSYDNCFAAGDSSDEIVINNGEDDNLISDAETSKVAEDYGSRENYGAAMNFVAKFKEERAKKLFLQPVIHIGTAQTISIPRHRWSN
ncbi:hypothetical protein [Parasitella parasitica]|uniref:Reverse transcriptase domain-containing protein n=1 Tax=Parasitella parasitica TaxID=35722 RepID=A0A0B7NK38_9FUNG|nr:hypothetical protein [Parasitella parasitica]